MSGYNGIAGIFTLTQSKANSWLRRTPIPPECQGMTGMDLVAGLFRHFGFEVTVLKPNWLSVKANPDQVWEVLSGQPSDPDRSRRYYECSLMESTKESDPEEMAREARLRMLRMCPERPSGFR
jgi:hypothetical protein